MDGATATVRVLGFGTLAFGVLGVADRARLARLMATNEDAARAIGFRDLGSALALLASSDKRVAVLQRMVFDLGDAAFLWNRKRGAAMAALAFAGLCAYTLTRV